MGGTFAFDLPVHQGPATCACGSFVDPLLPTIANTPGRLSVPHRQDRRKNKIVLSRVFEYRILELARMLIAWLAPMQKYDGPRVATSRNRRQVCQKTKSGLAGFSKYSSPNKLEKR